MKPSSLTPFTVLRFTLAQNASGAPTQRRETIGGFLDPELAFAAARVRAWQALRQLAVQMAAASAAGRPVLEIQDTEWGYDLRRDGQVVDRFWVHDARAREAC